MNKNQIRIFLTPKNAIIIVILILLVASGGIGIGIGLSYTKRDGQADTFPVQSDETKTTSSTLPIDPNAGDFKSSPPTQSTGAGVAIPGWGSITIPADKTEVAVNFPNPEANAEKYYLTFQLTLKDTGEVLYSSGLVPPGKVMQNITLSRALKTGIYDAVVKVQPYKMDQQTPTNNANMETKLVVQ